MKKIKNWLQSKAGKVTVATSVLASTLAGVASAEETTGASSTIISSLQTGFQTMASDALSAIGTIVVIALPVAGAIFLARKAISWFKSMAK